MENYDKTFNATCRLCLNHHVTGKGMVCLHSNAGLFHKNALLQLAKISVDFDDKLPAQICPKCEKTIEELHSFIQMCQNSEKKMRKLVNCAQGNSEECKEMISQYAMFHQYFPEFINNHTASSSIKYEKETEEGNSPQIHLKSECDDVIEYEADNQFDGSDDIDTVLDSIEKHIKSRTKLVPRKKLSQWFNNPKTIDSVLDSMEKVVTKRIKHSNLKKKVTMSYKPPKKNFTCNICNKTLKTQYSFNYHMQHHTVKYKFMCEHCGKGFAAEPPLTRHLIFTHGIGPFRKCDQCSFKCHKQCELVEHIRIHTGERPFTCEKCGLTFRRRAIWKNHLIQHEEKKIQCTACHRKFHRQSEMVEHYNCTHERKFLYMCSVCNTSYAKGNSVRKHMVAKHNIPRDKQGKIVRVMKDSNNSNLVFGQSNCMGVTVS